MKAGVLKKQVLNKVEEKKTLIDERREEMEQIFRMFDKNGDGVIQNNEIESFLVAIGRSSSKEDAKKLISDVDTDRNGSISREEFFTYMEKNFVVPDDQIEEVVDAFKIFDLDNNGNVSATEFKNILTKYGNNNFTDLEIDQIFNMIDLNHDGKLDYAEFIEMWKYE